MRISAGTDATITCEAQPDSGYDPGHVAPYEYWRYQCTICEKRRTDVKTYCTTHGTAICYNWPDGTGKEHVMEKYCPGHTVYSLGCGKTEGQAYLTCGKTENLSLICGHD